MSKSVNRSKRKSKSGSLQRKMMILFSIMLVIPILLVSTFSYFSANKQLKIKMQDATHSSVDLVASTINEYVSAAMRNVDLLSQQINSSDIDANSPETRTLIELFMKAHPELEILTVGNNQGAWMKAPDPGKQEYDPRTRDWYKATLLNPGKITIIDPLSQQQPATIRSLSRKR